MRRCLELIVLVGTTWLLIATSPPAPPCTSPIETVTLRAETTCGPATDMVVTTNGDCVLTASGGNFGGLPTSGTSEPGGIRNGFKLRSLFNPDGGPGRGCDVKPVDAGFTLDCPTSCTAGRTGSTTCEAACSGTLTRPDGGL